MSAAIADVAALERQLTPAVLLRHAAPDIAAAPLVIVDANLAAAALEVPRSSPEAALAGFGGWLYRIVRQLIHIDAGAMLL